VRLLAEKGAAAVSSRPPAPKAAALLARFPREHNATAAPPVPGARGAGRQNRLRGFEAFEAEVAWGWLRLRPAGRAGTPVAYPLAHVARIRQACAPPPAPRRARTQAQRRVGAGPARRAGA